MTEVPPPTSQPDTLHFPGKKRLAIILSIGLLSLGAAAIVSPYAFQAFSRDVPGLVSMRPEASQLYVQSPETIQEGQPLTVMLGWHHLPHGAKVQPVALSLRWQDISYAGKSLPQNRNMALSGSSQRQDLIFQSPGPHRVEIVGPDQSVWKTLMVQVDPYPATIFPAHWEKNRTLKQDSSHYHIWVNLHFDPKHPNLQRQYLQVTEDDRILERLLVSSGAVDGTTPLGEFSLGFKDFYPRSHKFGDAPMPFWSAINVPGHAGEVGFHSLEDGGYAWLLGRPASHGCVRMSKLPSVETNPQTGQPYWGDRGGARWIFDRVPQKTAVSIYKHKVPQFQFEDYEGYLVRQAREAKLAAQAKKMTGKKG